MAILKRVRGTTLLGEQAKREINRWFAGDLRDLLANIAAGSLGANERLAIEASEALAYLNWRENRRLHHLSGTLQPYSDGAYSLHGGDRCRGETFTPDDPAGGAR